jgi:uncharacterized membrane protein
MRSALHFLVGAIVGMLLSFCLAYVSGHILESMGIIMYESESGKRRNFNVSIVLSLLISLICGWVSVKYCPTKNSSGC